MKNLTVIGRKCKYLQTNYFAYEKENQLKKAKIVQN